MKDDEGERISLGFSFMNRSSSADLDIHASEFSSPSTKNSTGIELH